MRGGHRKYSDLAIEICLTLRVAFRFSLRQTQGFMQSIVGLKGAQKSRASDKPITLIVDSTGLKVHSEVGWNGLKHGAKGARKTW